MLRRPPGGEGRPVAQRKLCLVIGAALLLPFVQLVDGQQQHQHQHLHRQSDHQAPHVEPPIIAGRVDGHAAKNRQYQQQESHLEGGRVIRNLARTALTKDVLETPDADLRRKSTYTTSIIHDVHDNTKHNYNHIIIPDDASAVATLAPEQSVRAPPPDYQLLAPSVGVGTGIQAPPIARNLEDWEVEDFVLLATVDGDLFASDRKTGKELWHQVVEQPMIETTHYRTNTSIDDEDYSPIDHYLWAIEPNEDGGIYLWTPTLGLPGSKLHVTMKSLVEVYSPWSDLKNTDIVYTGNKKTEIVTLDADTGTVIKYFGSTGSKVNDQDSCLRPNGVPDISPPECRNRGTITLGRTEYTVAIARAKDAQPLATLKYSEWSPNNFDKDLLSQYSATMDNRYITSRPDGRVYGRHYDRDPEGKPLFAGNFPAPVARVFDIARHGDTSRERNPELVVLPQPAPPNENTEQGHRRDHSVFLNQTETGSWYVMSAKTYPLVLSEPEARISQRDWVDKLQSWDPLDLVGRHLLAGEPPGTPGRQLPTLPGVMSPGLDDSENGSIPPTIPTPWPEPSNIIDKVHSIPQVAVNRVYEFVVNPVLYAMVFFSVIYFGWWKVPVRMGKRLRFTHDRWVYLEPDSSLDETSEPTAAGDDAPQDQKLADDGTAITDGQTPPPREVPEQVVLLPVTTGEPPPETGDPNTPLAVDGVPGEKKRRNHRGRRGGAKHKKAKKREESVSRDDDSPFTSVEEAVNNAKRLGEAEQVRGPEPDIQTLPNGVEEVSNPILRIDDSLEVNEDQQLGTGSNGTIVYAGKWGGRAVAVKRMLRDFYDIASQETRLLRESDDHPNVIRYYAQQQRGNFIYIALELCQASLAEIIEKPHQFRELALAGQRDVPSVLYQIANGLSHLHNLRIVHRDLKPQNILVTMSRDGKPRVLVSDFGLCKKLEGTQSSFGATTAHAAGTSGWRAPELLLDDDVRDHGTALINADSTHSGNGNSSLVSPELLPNRRATRSIDIFSLGLVFFYVLTQGSHPFDCGDRYMREVNIRKGNYNLDKLDVLGEYEAEAKLLIETMIRADPRSRPRAVEVMAHPFFWSPKTRLNFLCDVSDHFEKEPRDPPSAALLELESRAPQVTGGDFLARLPKAFIESLGKQRKYTGSKLLDLLRALRNKKNHYEDMSDSLKERVGALPDGYLCFWTTEFANLLLECWDVVYQVQWEETDRFREYYEPVKL